MTELKGHTSLETAYLVADYPYSFKLRCKIRYWLEHNGKKGFRFVSQTENPKTGRWNAPKKSTYASMAASMYLDEKGHVQWSGVGEYSGVDGLTAYVKRFPDTAKANTSLVALAAKGVKYTQARIAEKVCFTINGVRQPYTDGDRERDIAELAKWEECLSCLK
jgi:hypothetical protein